MTCIVGLVDKDTVWLAGDSAGTNSDGSQVIIGDKKVFQIDRFAFGICGSPKVMDAIKCRFNPPKQPIGTNVRGFIGSTFIDSFKAALVAGGCVDGSTFSGEVLVAYQGGLFRIQGNFQVITSSDPFSAVGSGAALALGAMHSTRSMKDPRKRLINALEASAHNNATVRPPFNLVSIKKER